MRRLIVFSLATAFSILMNTASAAATDISGLAVGMSLSDARSLLIKINPDYKTEDLRFSDGKTKGLKAIAQKDGKPVDQLVIMANNTDAIWFIGRQQNYAEGQRIPGAELRNALIQKYGEPSYDAGPGLYRFSWDRDRENRLYSKKNSKRSSPCPVRPMMNYFSGTQIAIPESFSAECGIVINASASVDMGSQMVSQLVTHVTNVKPRFDELQAQQQAAQQEQQRLQQKEQANKPKL